MYSQGAYSDFTGDLSEQSDCVGVERFIQIYTSFEHIFRPRILEKIWFEKYCVGVSQKFLFYWIRIEIWSPGFEELYQIKTPKSLHILQR